ncbi:MAG: cation-translocating P-type ATPase [Lachnospiraceae bacterium]|nr:cation-translocating P-type ATPase [Lachnospiraceae bacterium]
MDKFFPTAETGLTSEQVNIRLHEGAINRKVSASTKTTKDIVKENIFTYFNAIFTILAILLIIVGSFRDLSFIFIIAANSAIGIFQELRSKKTLDNLNLVTQSTLTAIRDGEQVTVPTDRLVFEDCVILKAGNQIPADAEVLSGQVNVNESLLTGESDEIVKTEGDRLLSGSFIVSGECVCTLTAVGENSYISKLTKQATKHKKGEQSEMIRALNKLVIFAGIIIIPIGITLFVQQYAYAGNSFKDSVTSMVASVIGMIPEGLYLMATVALAVSAVRLANKKVLLHDMKCIETLARVDVVCVDKTGTITEPKMSVHGIVPATDMYDESEVIELLSAFVHTHKADNATMEALKEYCGKPSGRRVEKIQPFTSRLKYSGAVIGGRTYILGAPEFVLRDDFPDVEEAIKEFTKQGIRVLVFADYDGELEGRPLTEKAYVLGFVLLRNPIREGAKETFRYFANEGVKVRVISGDNPVAVSKIAEEAGIENADKYIDARELKTKEDYLRAVKNYTVFARVTPEQKRALIRAMKEQGETVAMTGDGVNDVLALKDADCSIAMASGSEAASQVAQLVLLDSDFSKMPSVVLEGRRVVNNIERSATLFLVKNIFSMLLSVFSVIKFMEYPLEPAQITLISAFTIGIPGIILALEPNKNKITGRFLPKVVYHALPAALTDFFVVAALVTFCNVFKVEPSDLSTSCTVIVAIVGFMIMGRIASPMNRIHVGMIAGCIIGWLFCAVNISHFFAMSAITAQSAMLMVAFAIITEPALRYLTMLFEAGYKLIAGIAKRQSGKRA